jgi:hypothetical protein
MGCLFWVFVGWLESLIAEIYGEAVPRRVEDSFSAAARNGEVSSGNSLAELPRLL